MLSSDLVRVSSRKGRLYPSYIKTSSKKWLEAAEQLIQAFEDHVGRLSGDLSDAVKDVEGLTPRFKITRGLAKLLYERTEIDVDSPVDPSELRTAAFELASVAHPVISPTGEEVGRRSVLEQVGERFEIDADTVERCLYADLKDAQRVLEFDPIKPDALLQRYNLSLAQAVLLRATSMTIEVEEEGELAASRFRQLFRYLKFFQLLHTITPLPGKRNGYRIKVDGPMSLFQNSGRYGFQMACFLPALVLCSGWSLEADLLWGPKKVRRKLLLSSDDGLQSHFREQGVYLTEEQRLFLDRFEALESDWKVIHEQPLVPLGGQGLWIPDFRLKNQKDGREGLMEIIGYWRSDYLQRRLSLLEKHGPENLILAVSDKMKLDKPTVDELPVDVIWFKRIVRAKLVLERLEEVAVVPDR